MSTEAMKLALEALDQSKPSILSPGWTLVRDTDIAALREALAQPQQEPVAWMFQHEETGRTLCVDTQQVEWGFEKGNPRLKKIAPLYTSPPAQQQEPLKKCAPGLKVAESEFQKPLDSQPARKPLTDAEKLALLKKHFNAVSVPDWFDALIVDIEAAHNIKENT